MKEIYYLFKSYKKVYLLSGLDIDWCFVIGGNIAIRKWWINIEINLICFEFIFEIGIIQEEENGSTQST